MKPEDQNTEYKQGWREEYLKWVCGFANAEGGRMVIGVAEGKGENRVVGVPGWKPLLEAIPNLMRDTMGMIAEVKHVQRDGKDLVEIIVPSYPVPISFRGVYYVRRGATNQRLSGPGLEAFLLKRRGLHWENLPCPRLRLKDISAQAIKRFKDLAIDKGRLDAAVRREAKEEFIANLHLLGKEGLSYAAALLFTDKAEKWIPGAYVKVGKFGKDEADLVYHDDVHGSLIDQAEKTLELIYFKYLKAKIRYENGEQRVEKFPFPREALRELILNALVHKDYASNTPVQISVSDDKLYIANVGALPENWTVKKLLGKHPSRPHNPTIAGCVYLTGKIETWGRGIRKVFDECRAHGCPPPVYEVSPGEPGDIQVCLHAAPDAIVPPGETPRPRAKMNRAGIAAKSPAKPGAKRPRPTKRPAPEATNEALNEALNEAINEAIKTSPGISAPQLMRLTGKSRATVGRCIAALIREGKIEHRGSRKTGGYYCATPQRDGGKA